VISSDVAHQIRRLRERRQLSQRALAEASGLSRNTLSLLERGQTSPRLATLQRIAVALEVDINVFFQEGAQSVTAPAGAGLDRGQGRQVVTNAGGYQLDRLISAHILRLDPKSSSGSLPAHSGEEFVYCLRGNCLYDIDERHYLLKPGDSLHFDGRLPHCCQNPGQEKAEALVVVFDVD
jgi:transcriptional regulator with XRE-family HTH domain